MNRLIVLVILAPVLLSAQNFMLLGYEVVSTGSQTEGASYIMMSECGTGWPRGTAAGVSYVLNHGLFGFEMFGICGDANGDGVVTPGDAYMTLNYLGSAGPQPVSCWAANANGDGTLTPADGFRILNFLGSSGPALNCQPCSFTVFTKRGSREVEGQSNARFQEE